MLTFRAFTSAGSHCDFENRDEAWIWLLHNTAWGLVRRRAGQRNMALGRIVMLDDGQLVKVIYDSYAMGAD